jgi:hypothetical protein
MKKSNQPNKARGRLGSSWARVFSTGAPKAYGERAQYREITVKALMIYHARGREQALEYLTWKRDWLAYYIGFGAGLPSSGALLDRLLQEEEG